MTEHTSEPDQPEPREPGSPGVVGEQPNRSEGAPEEVAPLDEHPLGHSPMESDEDVGTTTSE
jgi:hypothetical protein